MAAINNNVALTASELKDLRAWRAFIVEAFGRIYALDELRFALGKPTADVLSQFGLSRSEWAVEHWSELRRSLDAPIEVASSADADAPTLPEAA